MSYVVNTCVAPLCHSQDHPGSVPVPIRGKPAGVAPEYAFVECETLLGSRETSRTRHCRVRGLNQHHPPASPHAVLDQNPFRRTYCSIGGLTCHRRLRQELRVEVLHRDQLMIVDHTSRPHPGLMLISAGGSLLQLRELTLGALVPFGRDESFRLATSSHLPLRFRKLCGAALPVPKVRLIVGGVRGGRGGGNTPVDAYPDSGVARRFDLSAHYKRCVPMPETVSENTNRCGFGRKVPRPHYRDLYALRQDQLTVLDRKAASGIPEGGEGCFPPLVGGSAAILYLERRFERLTEGPQHLLLRHLGAFPQPLVARSSFGQQLRESAKSRRFPRVPLKHRLVPQESAAMPLGFQCVFGVRTGSQSIVVTHDLPHGQIITRDTDMYPQPDHPTADSGRSSGEAT